MNKNQETSHSFETITTNTLAAVTGGKKGGDKKSSDKKSAAPLGPTMQGALTKGGFQFSVAV